MALTTRKTQLQQVWELLYKNGSMTGHQVASAMEINEGSISSQLSALHTRGLATREQTHYFNEQARRCTLYKYTAIGDKYVDGWAARKIEHDKELKKQLRQLKQAQQMELPLAEPAPIVAPVINGHNAATPHVSHLPIDIESMTVREARAAYEKLKEFFGGAV